MEGQHCSSTKRHTHFITTQLHNPKDQKYKSLCVGYRWPKRNSSTTTLVLVHLSTMTHTSTWWCVSHSNCRHHVQRSESTARVEAYDPANSTSGILDDVDKRYIGNRSSSASSTLTSYLLCIIFRNTFFHVLVTYPESSRGLKSDINNFGAEIWVHHAST